MKMTASILQKLRDGILKEIKEAKYRSYGIHSGKGFIYILKSTRLFKIGRTHQPSIRIMMQSSIGPYLKPEPVLEITISRPTSRYKALEEKIHKCLIPCRAIDKKSLYHPREVYNKEDGALMSLAEDYVKSGFLKAHYTTLRLSAKARKHTTK